MTEPRLVLDFGFNRLVRRGPRDFVVEDKNYDLLGGECWTEVSSLFDNMNDGVARIPKDLLLAILERLSARRRRRRKSQ